MLEMIPPVLMRRSRTVGSEANVPDVNPFKKLSNFWVDWLRILIVGLHAVTRREAVLRKSVCHVRSDSYRTLDANTRSLDWRACNETDCPVRRQT